MSLKRFWLQFFTWWNGETLGTRFFTWRKGTLVGTDEAGNRYYRDPATDRRWVIYNGLAEPSRIPPGWHGWIHHTFDTPPPAEDYQARPWQKPHRPNHTGTALAYRPPGAILSPEPQQAPKDDYDAWNP